MALSLLTQPADIAGVRDPLWLELFCGGYRTSAATTASYTLVVTQNPDPDQTFSLSLPGGIASFVFVSGTPDDSGTQVQIGGDEAATTDNLVLALRARYEVDQLFLITEAADVITLTARTPGLVVVGFTNTSPVTLAFTPVSEGADAVYAANYSARVQVWVEDSWGSNTWSPLQPFALYPDKVERRARTQLDGLLLPKVGWQWPLATGTAFTLLTRLQRRYYFTAWEQHGDPLERKKASRSPIRHAWHAGSRNLEHTALNDIWSLIRRSDVLNPFLTHRGRAGRHEVSPGQAVYLSWYRRLSKVEDAQIDLLATVHYTDATSATSEIWTDTNGSGYAQWTVGQWNVGFRANNLHTLEPTKTPLYYTIEVRNASDAVVSETYTLHLADTDANETYVEYVNGLGVTELLRTKGRWEHGLQVEMEEAAGLKYPVDGALPSVQESAARMLLQGGAQRLEISTGFMDRGELNAMADLLFSPEWRWRDTVRGTRHPLLLAGAEAVLRIQGDADQEHLYALNLRFAVDDRELCWSDRQGWPAMPAEPEAPRAETYAP